MTIRTRVEITKLFKFEASHQLWNPEWGDSMNEQVFGKCSRMHGHSYKMEVTLSSPVAPMNGHRLLDGMVLNFDRVSEFVKPNIIELWDHYTLNDLPHFQGHLVTAERIATVAFDLLCGAFEELEDVYVERVTIHETDTGSATVTREWN